HNDALRLWASGMLERKTVKYKFNLTAVALANKVARIVFVLMTRGGQYDDRPVAGGFRREVQPRRQHWFLNEKSGFPFRTPAFRSVSRGQRRLGEKEYRAPSVTPGVALRPRTQGGLNERSYSIGSFRRRGDQHRGRLRSDVNQRKRLGSPNTGQRQYERERMMGRRATRTNHQGHRMPSPPRQQAVDMTAPETFTTASKQPLTKGRRPDMTGIGAELPLGVETGPSTSGNCGHVGLAWLLSGTMLRRARSAELGMRHVPFSPADEIRGPRC